jgi:hypothetical protein
MTNAEIKGRVRRRAAAVLPSRHAELLILCARIGFNP